LSAVRSVFNRSGDDLSRSLFAELQAAAVAIAVSDSAPEKPLLSDKVDLKGDLKGDEIGGGVPGDIRSAGRAVVGLGEVRMFPESSLNDVP
jgi:hypothetical protein